MKLKIHFCPVTRFYIPNQLIVHSRISWPLPDWQAICKLAMAEAPKPCKRHVD